MTTPRICLAVLALAPAAALACDLHDRLQPTGARPDIKPIDWQAEEQGLLSDHVMLTDPERFSRAGEAYFNPDLTWIIFQATERPPAGEEPSPHYNMYVAKLLKDDRGTITGIEEPIQISKPGSANTCGFFDPARPGHVIFGSTLTPPSAVQEAGYQRGESRYAWAFPAQMEVCETFLPQVFALGFARTFTQGLTADVWDDFTNTSVQPALGARDWDAAELSKPLFERPNGYDAECAFSPDGRHIVFSSIDPDTQDADLWVWDRATGKQTIIVEAEGYDGGPFFSPCGTRICYRSDRVGNDLLQIYVADLAFDDDGAITGIAAEYQLTDNEHVNWAPFWHPSGEHLAYATSQIAHWNYEVFAVEVPPIGAAGNDGGNVVARGPNNAGGLFEGDVELKRVTHANGFDGLPVYADDGSYMMWTSQRGPKLDNEQRPSSQVWVARVGTTAP
jgi:TolB protein